jgi:hypothetical protein
MNQRATDTIHEPARDVPVCYDCDVCVIGGSPTGLFAAIAAARMGRSAAVVETLGMFGGTATASLVCVWHSLYDTHGRRQIISGLSLEAMERLKTRQAVTEHVPKDSGVQFEFLPYELAVEFDRMVEAHDVRPFLHTQFVQPITRDDGRIEAVIMEDKTGRRAIRARMFVDASGDGDLAHRAGFEHYTAPKLQPPTTCGLFCGLDGVDSDKPLAAVRKAVFDQINPDALPPGFLWGSRMPGAPGLWMVAGTRIHGANCADADELTAAEIEGRRQIERMRRIIRRDLTGGDGVTLQGLPARIGIRQTRQIRCSHRLTEQDILQGRRFDDAIANGSYRVDVHSADGDGLVFRYLDGRQQRVYSTQPAEHGRWCDEGQATATFYQVPYGSLLPRGTKNLLVAGRCVDADEGAFGAIRVQVNCAQLGEAAGTAAALAIAGNTTVDRISTHQLRAALADHGAIII